MPAGRSRWVFGVWVALLLGLPLGWVLMGQGASGRTERLETWPGTAERPLWNLRLQSVPMLQVQPSADGQPHELEMVETRPWLGEGMARIWFEFDVRAGDGISEDRTVGTRVVRAQLEDLDGGGVWTAHAGERLWTGKALEFVLTTPGTRLVGEGELRRCRLVLWTRDAVWVGMRCQVTALGTEAAAPKDPGLLSIPVRRTNGEMSWAYPLGGFVPVEGAATEPGMSRARVLAGMWGWTGAGWIWFWVGTGVLLSVLGAMLLTGKPVSTEPGLDLGGRWIISGVAMGLLFLGLGLVRLLIAPPLHGVDEVSHWAGVREWREAGTSTRVTKEASRLHLDRIHLRPGQRFTALDLEEGAAESTRVQGELDGRWSPEVRWPIWSRWLRWTAWIWEGGEGTGELFRLRLLGLLAATMGVAMAAGLMARGPVGESGSKWLGAVWLWLPGLSHVAMGATPGGWMVGGMAVGGAAMASVVNQDRQGWRTRWVWGLGMGMVLQSGWDAAMTGVLYFVGLTGLALVRARHRSRSGEADPDVEGRIGWRRWTALGLGMLLMGWMGNRAGDLELKQQLERMVDLPMIPFWVGLLLVLLLWVGGESMANRWWGLSGGDSKGKGMLWVSGLGVAVVVVLMVNLVWPVTPMGTLAERMDFWEMLPGQGTPLSRADIPMPSDPMWTPSMYGWRGVVTFVTSWGVGDADYLMSKLFWQMAGSWEATGPAWVRWWVGTISGLGLGISFWRISQTRNRVRMGRLTMVLVGVLMGLVAVAWGSIHRAEPTSMQAMSVLGVYLGLLPVLFLGWKGLLIHWEVKRPVRVAAMVLVPAMVLHAAADVALLLRFLG